MWSGVVANGGMWWHVTASGGMWRHVVVCGDVGCLVYIHRQIFGPTQTVLDVARAGAWWCVVGCGLHSVVRRERHTRVLGELRVWPRVERGPCPQRRWSDRGAMGAAAHG